jgi:hypothetical protein
MRSPVASSVTMATSRNSRRLPELFEPGQPRTEDQEQLIAQLHQKIGQLTVDLDWLKKKSRQLGL